MAALFAPAAFAGVTPWAGLSTSVSTACADQTLVQPFLPWYDPGTYVFAPNGGLEGGSAGWALSGGASVASGNEAFFVHGWSDTKSLSLPSGAVATTPALCVGKNYPYLRLFTKGQAGASLKIDLLWIDSNGTTRTVSLGTIGGASHWSLSAQFAYKSWMFTNTSKLSWTDWTGTKYTAVALRLTASGGSMGADDLYVDPFKFH